MKLFVDSEVEEIKRNIDFIISTVKGTCPFYRDFGIDTSFIDRPVNEAKTLFIKEITSAIERYEPRAVIDKIEFNIDNEGALVPVITLKGAENE